MSASPMLDNTKPAEFALAVGKAMQNYGSMEYLVNDMLSVIIKDRIALACLVSLGIAKRLECICNYIKCGSLIVTDDKDGVVSRMNKIKESFGNRNKIAHNPMVVKANNVTGEIVEMGIHVVRFKIDGTGEEWLRIKDIESITERSRLEMEFMNELNGLCRKI